VTARAARPHTLGLVLKNHRRGLQLTQNDLAKRLGVEPAYISAIELDRRRPSLPLVRRLADVLGIKRETLFLLSHPEAKSLIRKSAAPQPQRIAKDRAWRDFKEDEALLVRYDVKPQELRWLAHLARLGKIRRARDFLYILNAIRQALEDS
jgi:transcriptional regulator with XRE-family HTH domain